jgi:FixJ family two-component response regulator
MGIDLQLQTNDEAISRRELASERVLILSPREKKFLRRLAKGETGQEIAAELGSTEQQISLAHNAGGSSKNFEFSQKSSLWHPPDELAAWPARPRSVKSEVGRR